MIQKYALICFAFFAFIAAGFGQVNIIPVRTDVAGFGTWTDVNVAGTTYVQLLTATSSTITPAMDFTFYTTETLSFMARTFGGVNAVENIITVSISTNNGATWTPIGTRTPLNATLTAMAPFDLSSYNGTQVRIRFTVAGTSNTVGAGIDDINIRGIEAPTYDSCLSVDFDDDFGNLPGGFVSTGGANTDPDFYQSAGYSRSLASAQTLRTPAMARPAAIEFYAIGSGAGGQLLTLEYTINGTVWNPLTTYNVTAAGATFYYDSSADTSNEPIVAYRITSAADTIYIDDLFVYCTCDLTASGIDNIVCNDNGTDTDASDDFITFELDPTVLSSSTTYNVSVSSGTITPNININYGGPTTFTLQNGSAGAGDVTVTITDGISGGCTLDVVVADPGSCSTGGTSVCFNENFSSITTGNNTATGGSGTAWVGNTNFPTVLSAYQAGGAVRLGNGTGSGIGSISSRVLNEVSGDVTVNLMVKGWTTIEGDLIVTLNGVTETLSYSQLIGGTFEEVTALFYDVPAGSILTIQTSYRRAFIDNIEIICSPVTPRPELQLVDADGNDQNCGYTINYGNVASNGSDLEMTFEIQNIGTDDLDVASLSLSGTNAGDYTVVSPVGAFTVAPSASQTVTVRFTPSANGTRTATLTINNNDANEGACTVLLTGVGFTPVPEINVEGNIGAFPDILGDGTNIPAGTNNTLYAAQLIGSSQTKSFWVNNEGTSNLTISNITIGGVNSGDFTINVLPNFNITPGSIRNELLEITFSPLAAGVRNATVTIVNNDADETNFVFNIRGTGNCVSATTSITPASGPTGTIVTVTGDNFGGTTTATVSGIAATVTVISATQIEVTVPAGATSGNIAVLNDIGCSSINSFTIIDSVISTCEGSGTQPSDLFISEVTDATYGGLTYVEIFNGTGGAVNLSDYALQLFRNGATTPQYTLSLNNVVLPNNSTYVLGIGYIVASHCSNAGGDGSLANQLSTLEGINKTDNQHDMLRLVKSGGTIVVDAFGVFGSSDWMNATTITGDRGFNFRRLNTASPLPSLTVFNLADWNIIDWVGSGTLSCNSNDYSDIGVYDFSVGTPPTVSILEAPTSDCDLSATLTVTGTEGFNGGGDTQELAYQWYYSAPGDLVWTVVTNGAIYDGATTNTLEILNTLALNGYQYYCQVREDDATCYTASNAVNLTLSTKTWNGSISNDWMVDTNWTPSGMPTDEDIVVIPSGNPILIGSPPFPPTSPVYAKSLIVLSGANLEIPTGKNLIVENCIFNYGTIDLKNSANLVQVNETNQNSGDGNFFMERIVSDVESLNYIYWSSPIAGFNLSGIPGSNTHRYYWSPTANNANGTQGNWIQTTGVMDEGVGYIIRASGATPNLNVSLGGNGLGTPQNGTFTTPISKGTHIYADPADDINNYWNLIGNPYPSAISADQFILENAAQLMDDDPDPSVIGTIYLWKHQATPNAANDNPFYEDFQINYDGSNYVAYNATGENPPGEFDGNIASGQAFFIVMDETTTTNTVTFTNAMRYGDVVTDAYNNGQFLRMAPTQQANESTNNTERHRLWLDLIAPNNTSASTLVGYVTGATNDKDRLFDGYETNATGLGFYSMVGYDRMGIQGRALPFDENDIVPLGVNLLQTGNYTIAINQVDGLFEDGQSIFLEDTYTNTIHNMRATPYTFQSIGGTFNDRFILRYTNSTLSTPDANVDTNLTIIELSNGHVKFSVGHNLTIESVEIYDMLGRTLYNLAGSDATEIYDLNNLSQAAYLAKVTLSNGQTITKRAVKRK